MTDLEIVRTLAEFEGWSNVYWGYGRGSISFGWHGNAPYDEDHGIEQCPPYLTSFDAVAAVWKKLPIECFDEIKMFRRVPWYHANPREHAEVMARAIIASKAKGGAE